MTRAKTASRLRQALSNDRNRVEDALRASEQSLRLTLDSIPGLVNTVTASGEIEFVNQRTLDYFGKTLQELKQWETSNAVHPDDLPGAVASWQRSFATGEPQEIEHRLRRADGVYRWFHNCSVPLWDAQGRIIRWYTLLTDIDALKQAEKEQSRARADLEKAFAEIKLLKDQLYKENLALRDEVDRASMFEEIVGNSPELKGVLSQVVKVAPTDSTVLIIGETGTGKELIARAIHKRSPRSERAFVSVNCAALPPSLISSELFGHEKGAFTGATQRRQGRFELADGGAIFLDEVGDLPPDMQVALLRVLQEMEFERVGGTKSIRVDVRVIAATNRNLQAAILKGTFRSDLFYRLNVFPIEIPPLRHRKDDVLTLLEYFVHRFARKVGKRFAKIEKRTVELFRSYDWPGNVRELQNVIERSVILSSDGMFSVDDAWFAKSERRQARASQLSIEDSNDDSDQEKWMIEAALAQSRGRVSGPDGAAAKLRMPPSTLDFRIRKLKIRKSRLLISSETRSQGLNMARSR